MSKFLVEIGVEDLPAEEAEEIAQAFREAVVRGLFEARLPFGEAKLFWTLRRLALLIHDLAPAQDDLVEEIRGPAVSTALDQSGQLTPAGQGFLRKYGGRPEQTSCRRVGDKEYLFLRVHQPGRPAHEILPQVILAALKAVPCSKSMRWDSASLSFIRPIRWIVALLDGEVLPLRIGEVEAGRVTRGHRLLAGPVGLQKPEEYREKLREAKVLVDPEERGQRLTEQLKKVEEGQGLRAVISPDLWSRLLGGTEWPTLVVGKIPQKFLDLPQPVVIAVLQEEGKFVPFSHQGRLAEVFAGFAEGEGDANLIRAGYERVVNIRLSDAASFFEEDRQRTLAERVPELRGVVYEARLGTMWDKVERVRAICDSLSEVLALPRGALDRAAFLSKADLLTVMVREFPELEGTIGGIYARLDGEAEEVAQAVAEHVLPKAKGDPIPESPLGVALSLADKLDSVIGAIKIGEVPTGSRDPYGVRRRAATVVRLILEKGLRLDLFDLIDEVDGLYPASEPTARVKEFLAERLRSALEEKGLAYDVIDAVLSVSTGEFLGAWERAEALQALRGQPELADLAVAFSRARNITKGNEHRDFTPELFAEEAEVELWRAYARAEGEVRRALAQGQYAQALRALLSLKAPIDRYFDEVLVMCEDEEVRANRLGFLTTLADLFLTVADLSRLVVPG